MTDSKSDLPILPIVPEIPETTNSVVSGDPNFYVIPHSDASGLNALLREHAALRQKIHANPALLVEPENDLIVFNVAYDKFHDYLKKRLNLQL